jgi:hypothetical protein
MNGDGNGKIEELSHEARDVSALAQAFQKMAEQAERLAESGESNAIRCIAAGEAMAYKMTAKRIREVIDPSVRRPIQIDTDALMVIYDSHIQMLEGLLASQIERDNGKDKPA